MNTAKTSKQGYKSLVMMYEQARETMGVRDSIRHVAALTGRAPGVVAMLLGWPTGYMDIQPRSNTTENPQ